MKENIEIGRKESHKTLSKKVLGPGKSVKHRGILLSNHNHPLLISTAFCHLANIF